MTEQRSPYGAKERCGDATPTAPWRWTEGPNAGACEVLGLVRQAAREASFSGQLPAFLAALEAVRTEVLLSVISQVGQSPERKPDRVLTVEQTAAILGRSRWWVYRLRHELPAVRFSTGRYGFSERRLEDWIRRRTTL